MDPEDELDLDLGTAVQNSDSQVDVEVIAELAGADDIYEEALENLKSRKPPATKPPSPQMLYAEIEAAAKIYYANVRTNVSADETRLISCLMITPNDHVQVLLAWVLTNVSQLSPMCSGLPTLIRDKALLMIGILSSGNTAVTFAGPEGIGVIKGYLIFILAFTAITSIVVSFCRYLKGFVSINNSDSLDQHCIFLQGLSLVVEHNALYWHKILECTRLSMAIF